MHMAGGARGRGRGNTVKVNAVQIGGGKSTDSRPNVEVENLGLSGLSSEQWKAVMSILNNQKSRTN